jgi:hypothetical protein
MDHLADIPKMGNLLFSLKLFFLVVIFHENGVSAAIAAFHLDIPAAFMHDHTCATANGAAFQFQNFLFHNFSFI